MWFIPRYEIVEEYMGGDKYWMIYRKWMWISMFWERWNTLESAKFRLKELTA